jgi:hypothetical protein
MAGNHLEDLVAQWYQYQEYFVRRNVKVGRRKGGGYDCELDVVAFHPKKRLLLHVEPSLDCDTWERREERYRKKFEAGKKHIRALFSGIELPEKLEQIALFVYGGRGDRGSLAGGRIVFIKEFMADILGEVRKHRVRSAAVPEEFPLVRTLQFAANYWPVGVGT